MKPFQITFLFSMNYFLKGSYDGILHLGLISFWNMLIIQYYKNNKTFQKLDLFLSSHERVKRNLLRGVWERYNLCQDIRSACMYDASLHNLQFSWKYLQRMCLTSCMFKRRPPIFQTMNKENIIFLHSSEYGDYSHSLEKLCQYIFPIYVPKSRF